jgi:hypothetical protein
VLPGPASVPAAGLPAKPGPPLAPLRAPALILILKTKTKMKMKITGGSPDFSRNLRENVSWILREDLETGSFSLG